MITGENFIGHERSAMSASTFKTFDPKFNIENQWSFFEANPDEISKAVDLAWQAFLEYRFFSGEKKAVFLRQIADNIEALGDELIQVYCKETGLPEGRAKGERSRTCFQLRMFADAVAEGSWVNAVIDTALPNREPAPKPDLRKMATPIGPIAVFGASNFPLAYSTAGGDTASALASGCPVVVKGHPMHAGTGELVASAIVKAAKETGMPNGVFSNLNSRGIEVGQHLVEHEKIKGIGFTGSIKGGRALFDLAAQRKEPIPVFAEMGSINPVVFLPNALKSSAKEWAKTYAESITLGTGQFCTNPGLLMGLDSPTFDEFIQTLSDEIVKIEPSCMLHPTINSNYRKNKEAVSNEEKIAVIADYDKSFASNYAQQALVKVDGATFIKNSKLHQEVFGPFSMVVVCANKEELVKAIQNLDGQLTGTIVADENELSDFQDVLDALQNRVGRLIMNGVPTGVEVTSAMQHGGPYPASTDSRFGAVGSDAINRWVRPISYQNWPNKLLPKALQNENPLGIQRTVNQKITHAPIKDV